MHEKPRHENTWQERYKHDNNKGDVIVIIIVVSLCNHLPNNPELQKSYALEMFEDHWGFWSYLIVFVLRMNSYRPNLLQHIERKKTNNVHQNDQK